MEAYMKDVRIAQEPIRTEKEIAAELEDVYGDLDDAIEL